jgi:zinc transport system permease protein
MVCSQRGFHPLLVLLYQPLLYIATTRKPRRGSRRRVKLINYLYSILDASRSVSVRIVGELFLSSLIALPSPRRSSWRRASGRRCAFSSLSASRTSCSVQFLSYYLNVAPRLTALVSSSVLILVLLQR